MVAKEIPKTFTVSRLEGVCDLLVLGHRLIPADAVHIDLIPPAPDPSVEAARHPLERRIARGLGYGEVDALVEGEVGWPVAVAVVCAHRLVQRQNRRNMRVGGVPGGEFSRERFERGHDRDGLLHVLER